MKRVIFSRWWYVKAKDHVYGPHVGEVTEISLQACGSDVDLGECAIDARCELLTQDDVRHAKEVMAKAGCIEIKAVSVTQYLR